MTANPPASSPPAREEKAREEKADTETPLRIDDAPVADDDGFPDARSPRQ